MIKKVEAFSAEMLPGSGETLYCAVSGGADSMCMLTVMLRLGKKRGFDVSVLHFNHGLRGIASDNDAEFVVDYCAKLGVPCVIGKPSEPLANASEETARNARYSFLFRAADDGCKIATAHNANDNAEQFLMRLNGIPHNRQQLIRPLLCVTRSEIERFNRAYNVPCVDDASNLDRRYTRNRVRLDVMPTLTALNPRFAEQVLAFTTRTRRDDEYLYTLADNFLTEQRFSASQSTLKRNAFNALPAPIASRVIILCVRVFSGGADSDLVNGNGGVIYREHVETALTLSRQNVSGKQLQLPRGLVLRIEREQLVFSSF
jgi:tRNA(Ile)-lysidine synthase